MFKSFKKINLLKLLRVKALEKNIIFLLALVIFIGVNFLISSISMKLDLSKGKAYTLSPSTKKILKKLDDIVNIKFFVSSDLPTRLLPLKIDVVALLNEYKKEGGSKITTRLLDPKKDEKALNEAKELGIPEIQFSQLEQDKYAVTSSYFAMILSFGDKKELLPQVTDLESLEYNLTAAIYKLTKKDVTKIGVLGYEQSFNPQEDNLYSLKKILEQQFSLDFIDISSNSAVKEIDPSYKALLIFDNNKKSYNENEITQIKNYLSKKGKAIFFVDGVWVMDDLTTVEAGHDLFSIFEEWGIKINNNLVLSTSAELVNFGNASVQFFTAYPFWLKTNNFNQKTSYFSNINQLTFPWTASISLQKKSGIENSGLIKTTKNSWEQKSSPTSEFVLNPQNIPQPQKKDVKEFLITAESKNKNGGEIIVVPSSRFVLERFLTRTATNLEFVLNALNNLASEGALSGIKSRAVAFYPLPDLPENQKDIFKYSNILLFPLAFAIFGMVRLLRRK